ncbi:hypothetical protein ANO11243_036010 [Dothideomycetidae sp. 11243]|nr:hypothetical protein ANO11243_036010 [fungal sp. No.11243]
MVHLTATPASLRAFQVRSELVKVRKLPSNGEPDLSVAAVGDPVSHTQLIELSKSLRDYKETHEDVIDCSYDLETLLRGAKVYVPPPPTKAAKSPEYVQLMVRLREEEERRAYERMINPPALISGPLPGTFGASLSNAPQAVEVDDVTFSDVNRQMTLIINVLVSIIACSVGIWVTAWHWDTPARLALSLIGSFAVAVAEVAIYLGYIKRLSDAKSKERLLTESKEVVETWVFDSKTASKRSAGGRDESLRHRKGKHS